MSNRISTGMMFSQSVGLMLNKQSKLAHLQEQLATGKRLVTAKDDPVAAGTAVGLDRALASLTRFGENANIVQNRLGQQENALAQANDLMARVTELTIQAGNAALTTENRKAIATELESLQDNLLALANSTDGTGRYLFGGAADDAAPFARVNGQVVYSGDQTQKQVEIAPDTLVSDAMPGSEVFMRIRTGDGTIDAHANSGNTGSGLLMDFSRDAADGSWNGQRYTVTFTAADAYTVYDANGDEVSTGTYASGGQIGFGGVRMRIDGAPAVGDSFEVGPAQTRDVFATLDSLITTLKSDPVTASDKAVLQNGVQSALRDVGQAANSLIDARASGGSQLAAIDNATELRNANEVTLKTALSSIRDLDYAEAIGQYQLEQAALQAAQTIFTQMQGMSLFNKLG